MRIVDENKNSLTPRESGEYIASRAKYVQVDQSVIDMKAPEILRELREDNFDASCYTSHVLHPNSSVQNAAQWVFLIDCLNFSFWTDSKEKFTIDYHGVPYTGYFALCGALKRAMENGYALLKADFCLNLTIGDCEKIFQSSTSTDIPLIKKRLEVFHEFGKVLIDKFDGSFENCIKMAKNDALALVTVIESNFPCFVDEANYDGRKVKFLKRAQIVVADLFGCFHGKGLGYFHNINALTTFADYRIPQCLNYFGILKYSDELVEILKNEISQGSVYEVEIRGATINAVDRLVTAMKAILEKNGSDSSYLNAVVVDFFLWEYARNHKWEVGKMPFHKVRSTLY